MDKSIFLYTRYKSYLADYVQQLPKAGRGFRNKLAEATRTHNSYITQVMSGSKNFSIEQATAAASLLALSPGETEYFVWMVELEKAGTPTARAFFERLMQEASERFLQLKNRVRIENELADREKAIYYSDSLYAGVHMAVTIPDLRTVAALQSKMKVSRERIVAVLEFLKKSGLIEEANGLFKPTTKMLFLDKKSPFIFQHHSNFRVRALKNLSDSPDSVHLSMVVTLSRHDREKLKSRLAKVIEEFSDVIKSSAEEELMALNIDFFDF